MSKAVADVFSFLALAALLAGSVILAVLAHRALPGAAEPNTKLHMERLPQ